MSLYSFLHKALSGIVKFVLRVKVEGAENEPEHGPFLVCANHISEADVAVLGATLKCDLNFVGKKELFSVPVFGKFARAMGVVPIDRQNNDVGAIKKIISLLEDGHCVALYPQGTRRMGVDPRQTSVKQGAAMIAYHAHADVLPVLIRTKDYRMRPFRRVTISIGKPIAFEELGIENPSREEYKAASELIFSRITEMIPEDK